MRIIYFFDDTRIRTSEGHQDYTRTVYVQEHNMSQAAVVYLPVLSFFTKK